MLDYCVTSSRERAYFGRLRIMEWDQKRDGVKGVGRAAGEFKTTVDAAFLLHLLILPMHCNLKHLLNRRLRAQECQMEPGVSPWGEASH